MSDALFLAALHSAVPGVVVDPARLSGLDAFAFVSEVIVPPYLSALQAAVANDHEAAERFAALAGVVEAGFESADDDLVDALAMRLVERHLCRDPALLARARPTFGPATARVVAKFEQLIETADRRVAQHRAGA